MKRTFIASTIVAAFALAAASAFAQTPAPTQPAPQAQTQADRVYGYQLMTPEERSAYQEKMRAAATWEERQKIRDEHRALMDQRAKEKGVTLAEPRGHWHGAGPGPGSGPRGGPGGPGAGPRGDGPYSPYSQLFTPEERNAFRDKMQAAATPEEREKLRSEYRAQAESRAKEQGITLPPPGPRAGGPGPHGGHRGGPGAGPGGRGGMYGDLLTPEERQAFHDQMQAAKTPEERDKVRESHHAALQARAKEKGISMPGEPCGPGGPGAGPGPRAECNAPAAGPRGPRAGAGAGAQWRGAGTQLLSAEERAAFRSQMQAATTAEERQKVRDEHRAIVVARAKEQGITLPERGYGWRGHGFRRGPSAPGYAPQPNVPQQPFSA
jgi:hypothetical protein